MIRLIIDVYTFLVLLDAILSWLPQFEREQWRLWIKKVVGYSVDPVRRFLSKQVNLEFDISHLIVLIVLQMIPSLW